MRGSTGPGLTAILLGLLLAGCGGEPSPEASDPGEEEPALAAEVWAIAAETITEERRWSGRLESLRTVSVQAPGPARVTELSVSDGEDVRAGALLIRLEAPALEVRRDVLGERLAYLEGELERWRRLSEAGAAGPAELSEAVLRVLEVREALGQVEGELGFYQIRAPVAGQVGGLVVGPGTQVEAGQPLLRIDEADARGVRLMISALETGYLEPSDRLSFRDDTGRDLQLARVSWSPADLPGFVLAHLYFDGAGNGRIGHVEVSYSADERVLLVPWTAVASDADGQWVTRLMGDPARAERRSVELGRAHSEGIEVLEGLEEGDRVLRYEPRSIPEGRRVDARDPRL